MKYQLLSSRREGAYTIHQTRFPATTITTLLLDHTASLSTLIATLEQALSSLGLDQGMQKETSGAWVDVSISGLWEQGDFGGAVPCRTIWDAEGRRMAAVLVFEGF